MYRRILIYILGLLFLAFGVAFSVNSNLGVSPINSLPYVVSQVSRLDIGKCVICIFSMYIFLQMLLLRKEFAWIQLTQLVFSTIFGYFVDFAKWVLGPASLPGYPGQLVMLTVSIILVAVGVCLYMDAGLVNMPMEGLTAAVKKKLFPHKPFSEVKIFMDCLTVAIGIALSLICLRRLDGIREGTILCAVLVGRLMKPMQRIIEPQVKKFCRI